MNRIVGLLAWALCLSSHLLLAQGPPVRIDTCQVGTQLSLKALPIPGEGAPGTEEALAQCPRSGICIAQIHSARVGKIGDCRLLLRMHAGKLMQTVVITDGPRGFKQMYRQMVLQAGNPSKMIDSHGDLTYVWDMKSKVRGDAVLQHWPGTGKSMITIDLSTRR
jgi:hypothetical protein